AMFNAELIVPGAWPPGAALGVLRPHAWVAQRLKFFEGFLQSHGCALRLSGCRFGLRWPGTRRLLGCHFLCHGYFRPMMAAQIMERDSDQHHTPEWAPWGIRRATRTRGGVVTTRTARHRAAGARDR